MYPNIRLTPAKKLAAAILRRAVWDFALYRDASAKREPEKYEMAMEAAGWLFSDEHVRGEMTFIYICEVLGLEPEHVRRSAIDLDRDRVHQLVPDEEG